MSSTEDSATMSSFRMIDLHMEVLRQQQRALWDILQKESALIHARGFYLAGGTALALRLGHRESQDFDFFSQIPDIEPIRAWIDAMPDAIIRDVDADTIHAEIAGVKVSFIAGYRYPLLLPPMVVGTLEMADITDIALMKMLAVTHRATLRDYLDLAVIVRDHCTLEELIQKSTEKYGPTFNVMLCVRAMVQFEDLDKEMPVLLDASLETSWKEILRSAVKKIAAT